MIHSIYSYETLLEQKFDVIYVVPRLSWRWQSCCFGYLMIVLLSSTVSKEPVPATASLGKTKVTLALALAFSSPVCVCVSTIVQPVMYHCELGPFAGVLQRFCPMTTTFQ